MRRKPKIIHRNCARVRYRRGEEMRTDIEVIVQAQNHQDDFRDALRIDHMFKDRGDDNDPA
jgi:hypothetical protein